MDLEKNYFSVINRLKSSVSDSNHKVDLLAVSKKQPLEKIQKVYELGQRAFGESYVQEAEEKILRLRDYSIEWHFIGPLQSNKSKIVAALFDWVQSVDSLKLLRRLNDQRPVEKSPLNVLLQYNVSEERQKRGLSAQQILELATEMKKFTHLKWRGLMCIPEFSTDPEVQKHNFSKCWDLYQKLQAEYELDTLSMGMSGDMEAAIDCGSTMIRVGTDIFGQRD